MIHSASAIGEYRACKRTGRTLVIDRYTAEVLRRPATPTSRSRTGRRSPSTCPSTSASRSSAAGASTSSRRTPRNAYTPRRSPRWRRAPPWCSVPPCCATSTAPPALAGARAIWSQWDGYLKQPRGEALHAELAARGIPLASAHISVHASIPDLQRLATAVAPWKLVPIHTFEPDRFPALFGPRVALKQDGVRWSAAT